MRSKFVKFAQMAAIGLALIFTFSCSGSNDPEGVDDNGGGGNNQSGGGSCSISSGETVTIGSQTWMSKNLNCNVAGSKCYNNEQANCSKYGRLYTWEAAKSACPSGWHLPSDEEWEVLVNSVGGSSTAGTKLKATSDWDKNGNGTDTEGFRALPGGFGFGYGSLSGVFDGVGVTGYWWSVTEFGASEASYHHMYYGANVNSIRNGVKANFLSVRCVKN